MKHHSGNNTCKERLTYSIMITQTCTQLSRQWTGPLIWRPICQIKGLAYHHFFCSRVIRVFGLFLYHVAEKDLRPWTLDFRGEWDSHMQAYSVQTHTRAITHTHKYHCWAPQWNANIKGMIHLLIFTGPHFNTSLISLTTSQSLSSSVMSDASLFLCLSHLFSFVFCLPLSVW